MRSFLELGSLFKPIIYIHMFLALQQEVIASIAMLQQSVTPDEIIIEGAIEV